MSRAVPNQDSSPESFARLLNRLTKTPGSYSPALDPDADPFPLPDPFAASPADDYAVRVSISRDGAAALNGSRKRPMTPVRQTRNAAEAGEISYEHALRLHSRPRATELPEPTPLPAREEKNTPPAPRLNRAQAEAKALSALRQAKNRASGNRSESSAAPKAAATTSSPSPIDRPSPTATRNSSRRTTSNKKKSEPSGSELRQAAHVATSSRPQPSQMSRKTPPSSAASSHLPANPSATASHTARKSGAGSIERRQSRTAAQDQPAISSLHSSSSSSSRLDLEVASPHLALTQRQSIVSIRLSALESEQLRERAAESGISVSAYMRSCVLEAEHLRSQVKQALAELRTLHPLPTQPQLEPPPLFSSVYLPPNPPARDIRPGLFGFLSGIAAIVLGRFQR